MRLRMHAFVSGRVQGVFYRYSTQELARELGVTGWVKNLLDGRVEIMAEGKKELLESLLTWCHEGPTFARVDDVEVEWKTYFAEFVDFEIAR